MSTEEQRKAVFVILPEVIGYASPELSGATEVVCRNLNRFIDYVQTLDPLLERHEAITFTAAILDGLPALLETDPDLIDGLKAQCHELRSHRQ